MTSFIFALPFQLLLARLLITLHPSKQYVMLYSPLGGDTTTFADAALTGHVEFDQCT